MSAGLVPTQLWWQRESALLGADESVLRAAAIDRLDLDWLKVRLKTRGYAVVDHVFDARCAEEFCTAIQAMDNGGKLRQGKIQHGTKQVENLASRDDRIAFIDQGMTREQGVSDQLRAYMQQIDALRIRLCDDDLSELLGGNLEACTFMCANYPGNGAQYVKHRDALPYRAGRKLTVIYYMNKGWQPEHGGQLLLWPADGSSPVELSPRADRLVLFISSLEHQVLPAWAPRYALTAWMYNRRDTALEALAEELRERKQKGRLDVKALLEALDSDDEDGGVDESLDGAASVSEQEKSVERCTARIVIKQIMQRKARQMSQGAAQ